ncbi:hypothetical protein [Paenibacillus sp. Marseille-Q7038]
MIRKNVRFIVFVVFVGVVALVLSYHFFNNSSEAEEIIDKQKEYMTNIQIKLNNTTEPLHQLYGSITNLLGLNEGLISLANSDKYADYGRFVRSMLEGLEINFNSMVNDGFNTNDDREFLMEQTKKVMDYMDISSLDNVKARTMKDQLFKEFEEYSNHRTD